MDRLESLGNQISQLTMYDLKSYYNQAKNVVLNISEMESKVREATNDEPWGASSTLMQEIAQGTFNFQQFNEIMPCIYSRFMEKEARQWREIYKALQLLEYLIKNGSERVVDDARSHLSTVKMLRNFHYIDEKGKDQGINVRNRAKEIAELLSDVDRIRQERRKAKSNRTKYTGTGNDGGMSFSSGGGRYGGFGNDSLGGGGAYDPDYSSGGGYSGGGSGNGGGSGSGSASGRTGGSSRRGDSSRQEFEEYDAGDWEDSPKRSTPQPSGSRRGTPVIEAAKPAPKAKEPEVDLLGFGDDNITTPAVTTKTKTQGKPLPNVSAFDDADDDFADFQSAPAVPVVPTPTAGIKAAPAAPVASKPNVFDMLGSTSSPVQKTAFKPPMVVGPTTSSGFAALGQVPAQSQPQAMSAAARPMYTGGMMSATPLSPTSVKSATPTSSKPGTPGPTQSKPAGGFDDLWSMSLGSSAKPTPLASNTNKSIKDLEKEKANANMWGQGQAGAQKSGAFGNFGGGFGTSTTTTTNSGSGGDDLLL